jgi:hypothetical protein
MKSRGGGLAFFAALILSIDVSPFMLFRTVK